MDVSVGAGVGVGVGVVAAEVLERSIAVLQQM